MLDILIATVVVVGLARIMPLLNQIAADLREIKTTLQESSPVTGSPDRDV